MRRPVAPFVGAWIEIFVQRLVAEQSKCRTLYECVSWNMNDDFEDDSLVRRTPCGYVCWNILGYDLSEKEICRTLRGVRVLKFCHVLFLRENIRHALYEHVSWNYFPWTTACLLGSRIRYECVYWNYRILKPTYSVRVTLQISVWVETLQ